MNRWQALLPRSQNEIQGMQNVANTGNSAFNTLETALQTVQNRDAANWDNQKKLNTTADVIALQKSEDLQGFNANEDQFSLEGMTERHSAQVDTDEVAEAMEKHRARLRGEAVDEATLAGQQAAKDGVSAADGIEAFKASLLGSGAKAAYATGETSKFEQTGMKPLEARWAEDTDRVTADLIADLSGEDLQTLDIGKYIEEARAQHGENLVDETAIFDQVGRMQQRQANKEIVQNSREERARNKNVYSVGAKAMEMLRTDGDKYAAEKFIADNAMDDQAAYLARQQLDQESKSLDLEGLEVNAPIIEHTSKVITDKLDSMLVPGKNKIASLQTEQSKLDIVSDDIYQQYKAKSGGNLNEAFKASTDGNGLWGLRSVGSAIVNDEEFQEMLVPLRNSMIADGFSPEEADKTMLSTIISFGGTTENWNGAEGFHRGKFLDSVARHAVAMADYRTINSELTYLSGVMAADSTVIASEKMREEARVREAAKKAHRTRKAFKGGDYLKKQPEYASIGDFKGTNYDAKAIRGKVLPMKSTQDAAKKLKTSENPTAYSPFINAIPAVGSVAASASLIGDVGKKLFGK